MKKKGVRHMVDLAVTCLTEVVTLAVPVAVVFEIGNLIVCTFMRTAFGGKLWFGR